MIERADQMVLNYVSRAADAAHGVLRPDQRLDFARRLRARIEAERRGSQDARDVAKVLTRFGDPVALVEREARRLAHVAVVVPALAAPLAPVGLPAVAIFQVPVLVWASGGSRWPSRGWRRSSPGSSRSAGSCS
ncbi:MULTISPECIES: hypothetical protein [unclassified Nonomuraea]|uniref:hypothetical protein n=1 Tax=unclassified Nonomuraea TaxID=2593643 RepID=UPI0033DEF9D9